jgi:predicted porin
MFNLGENSMKKTLVALAALAATSAFAQSSVTMYGAIEPTVDVGYKLTRDTNFNSQTSNQFGVVTQNVDGNTRFTSKPGFRIQDGNSQGNGTSRIGWRGVEDLGGGLQAKFQLEMGLRIDDGCATTEGGSCSTGLAGFSGNSGGNLFGRNAWAGVAGSFGEVRLGRQVLGSFSVAGTVEPTGSSNGLYSPNAASFGGINYGGGAVGQVGTIGAIQGTSLGGVRFSDSIKYITPNFSGFSANISLSAPEVLPSVATNGSSASATNLLGNTTFTATSTSAKRKTGLDLALEYANGPIYVGFGYNKRDAGVETAVSNANAFNAFATSTTVANPSAGTVLGGPITGWVLGGSYDFGVIKPYLSYTRIKSESGNGFAVNTIAGVVNTTSVTAIAAQQETKVWAIGARAPIGPATLIASYSNYKTDGARAAATVTGTNVAGALVTQSFEATNVTSKQNGFQIGVQYPLSKRTLVEANYGVVKNDASADGSSFSTTGGVLNAGTVRTRTNGSFRESGLNIGIRHQF